jgi:hypothetical protein
MYVSIVFSQTAPDSLNGSGKNDLRVFIDCNYCDQDYIKKEIGFVNYVRDRNDAQIFILITDQTSGSGGTEYTVTFTGKQDFDGLNDTLIFNTKVADAEEIFRKQLVRTLKLGLIRYVSKTPAADKISISYTAPAKPMEVTDTWDYWMFSISGSGFFNGEKAVKYAYYSGSLSASRVTNNSRMKFSIYRNYTENKYNYADYAITNISKGMGFDGLVVLSLDDHWSAGGYASGFSSTYSNTDISLGGSPAIEYNIYPYSEATRRQLRFQYLIGYVYNKYSSETIYDKTSEHLFKEQLAISLSEKDSWGSASISVVGRHYFHDFAKNNVSIYGSISFRLIGGLSIDIYGQWYAIHDQLSLPKGEASQEDLLLQRRQLETSYSYYLSLGLSYTFGSIYNNIVNPRFGN